MKTMNRKIGGKTYRIVYVAWASGGELYAKESAKKRAIKLRRAGFSSRIQREMLVKDPRRGPEAFYNVLARKDGMTLDEVEHRAQIALGIRSRITGTII